MKNFFGLLPVAPSYYDGVPWPNMPSRNTSGDFGARDTNDAIVPLLGNIQKIVAGTAVGYAEIFLDKISPYDNAPAIAVELIFKTEGDVIPLQPHAAGKPTDLG